MWVRRVNGLGGGGGTQAGRRYSRRQDLQSLGQDWSGKVETCVTAEGAGLAGLTVAGKTMRYVGIQGH